MNQANVEALRKIVLEMAQEFTSTLDGLEWDEDGQQRVAEWLAARGVLVPASLSDEECAAIRAESTERYEGFLIEAEMRAAMERIAKDEP